jgi:integrase
MRPLNKRKLSPLDGTRLRPKAKTFLVWDTLERGLALQVQPTGHKSFKFIYHYKGRSRWVHLGSADTVSLAQAREEATRLRLKVHQKKDPAAERRASASGSATGTFAALATRYVAEYSQRKNKSWKQAANLVTRNVLPHWADRDAGTITRADVRAIVGKIDAPKLHNQVLASASAIFSWAMRQEILTNNPCRGVERHAVTSRERVLSDAEVPLFWHAFDSGSGLAGVALKVLLLTGQRPGEVAHLRHEHIAEGWWTLPGAPEPATRWPGTKNGATHRVWLPAKVREIIAELNTDDNTGFVFGQVWPIDAAMRDICKALNIPRATPHDLRRTHGTTTTGLGFGRDAMNRIQNHKEGGIASVYDRHQYADENKRIMEAVAQRLLSLAGGAEISTNVVPMRS